MLKWDIPDIHPLLIKRIFYRSINMPCSGGKLIHFTFDQITFFFSFILYVFSQLFIYHILKKKDQSIF